MNRKCLNNKPLELLRALEKFWGFGFYNDCHRRQFPNSRLIKTNLNRHAVASMSSGIGDDISVAPLYNVKNGKILANFVAVEALPVLNRRVKRTDGRSQFHQHFTRTFFVWKWISLVTFGFVIFLRQNFVQVKRWWKWRQVSISPTFFQRLFCTKANFSSNVWLCNFMAKELSACKMLVKLATGFNFTDILHETFLFESFLHSFSL